MRLAAQYSHNNGLSEISRRHASLLAELHDSIICAEISAPKSGRYTMKDELFDLSVDLGEELGRQLSTRGWTKLTIGCDSPSISYLGGRKAEQHFPVEFREVDFVKYGLGVEVQFGKPSLPVCSACAKMTIFHNLGHIDCGIEIVPVKALALEMSSGVSYFEQFVWDLRQRGVADIDIPVLILGIDA